MATKTLQINLADIEGLPIGAGNTITGQVWVQYSHEVRTTDGKVIPLNARKYEVVPVDGVVSFDVIPNDDATVVAEARGFTTRVGWELSYRANGRSTTVRNYGTDLAILTADPATVKYTDKTPVQAVPPQFVTVDQLVTSVDNAEASAAASALSAESAATSAAEAASLVDAPADTTLKAIIDSDATTSGAYLRNTFARASRPSTVVYLGDSITASNIAITATSEKYGENHAVYTSMLLGQRLRMVDIKGVSGNTVEQMEARLQADVIAKAPGWCFILAGTNNVLQDRLTEGKASLERIIDTLRKAGIEPILATVPPNTTKPANARLWNAYLKRLAQARSILLVDYFAALVDVTTGGWKSGYDSDGTHPTNVGSLAMGLASKAALDKYLPPPALPLVGDDASTLNLLAKGMFTAGVNGNGVPSSWSSGNANPTGGTMGIVGGTGTLLGNWFQIDKTGAVGYNVNQIKTTGFSVGDRLAYLGKFEAEALAGGSYGSVSVSNQDGASAHLWDVDVVSQFRQAVSDLTFYREFTVPAGTTKIRCEISLTSGGTGKFRIGQMTLVNLTTGAILL